MFFGGNDKKDKKDYYFEIRMDNDTNWHPRSLPHAKAQSKVRH